MVTDFSQFFAILRPLKGYQTAFVVCKMVRGVPMIPRNSQDNILLQYMSKYWAKMGQKLKKLVKNGKKCPKWDLNFSYLKLFYGQIMHFYEDRNLFFIV